MSAGHKAIKETITGYQNRIDALNARIKVEHEGILGAELRIEKFKVELEEKKEAIEILERIV